MSEFSGIGSRQSAIMRALGCVTLAFLLVACPGEANEGIRETTLEGETQKPKGFELVTIANLEDAPTDAHRRLARLLPPSALVPGSVAYGGWNAAQAAMDPQDPANAPMPTTTAEYLSKGYKLVAGEGRRNVAQQDYPQACSLFVIQAPEAQATEPLVQGIREKLASNGFARRDPLELALGLRRNLDAGDDVPVTREGADGKIEKVVRPEDRMAASIERYVRIDQDAGADRVYVAYLYQQDDLVVYALENERPKVITDKDGTRISPKLDDQRGSRVGAQLIALLLFRMQG